MLSRPTSKLCLHCRSPPAGRLSSLDHWCRRLHLLLRPLWLQPKPGRERVFRALFVLEAELSSSGQKLRWPFAKEWTMYRFGRPEGCSKKRRLSTTRFGKKQFLRPNYRKQLHSCPMLKCVLCVILEPKVIFYLINFIGNYIQNIFVRVLIIADNVTVMSFTLCILNNTSYNYL